MLKLRKRRRLFGAVLGVQGKSSPLPLNANVAGVIQTGARELLGWCIAQSSAATAGHFRIRDGSTANAPIIAVGRFVAGADSHVWLADQAIALQGNGSLWIEFPDAGSYEGCVYYA